VRVVDEHREVLPRAHRLEAARHAHAILEGAGQHVEVHPERMRRSERRERVRHVEATRQGQRELALARRGVQPEAAALEAAAQLAGAVVGGGIDREGDRPIELVGQSAAVLVAHADHAHAGTLLSRGWREQPALGLEVVIHRGMEVEMILGQVREDRRREADRARSSQLERV
jgi:hypothetical protein